MAFILTYLCLVSTVRYNNQVIEDTDSCIYAKMFRARWTIQKVVSSNFPVHPIEILETITSYERSLSF